MSGFRERVQLTTALTAARTWAGHELERRVDAVSMSDPG
jgi:hypothetical protein